MAQNTVQNSSVLYPEDVIVYVSTFMSSYSTISELVGASWTNVGALGEFSVESANATVQPAAFNVEHEQVLTKEAETINLTIQEINTDVISILRGGISQTTTIDLGTTSAPVVCDAIYSGGADNLTPMMVWVYAKYTDGRSRQVYYPYVHYVSGGSAANPKAQGTGEYSDMSFTLEARESTTLMFNKRRTFKIELSSTSST